jgi:hypothetical protein
LRPENRVSSAQISPAGTLCFDIFSPLPGDSEVITQLERLRYYGACDEEIVSIRRTERWHPSALK